MMQEEQIQALTDIGLTVLQAKTYLYLAKLGEADVGTISKASSLARQDIYRIMPSLEKLGLAEKILTKPVLYKATPVKEGVLILLQKRRKENEEVLRKAKSLMRNSDSLLCPSSDFRESQFKITSEETLLLKMHNQLIEKAESTIDILVSTETLREHSKHNLYYLKRAIKRGVKIRLIAHKGRENFVFKEPETLEDSVMEIRYSSRDNPVDMVWFGMHIFDRTEVTMCVSKSDIVPSLWSNSPPIIELAEEYYENLWRNAVPIAQYVQVKTIKSR